MSASTLKQSDYSHLYLDFISQKGFRENKLNKNEPDMTDRLLGFGKTYSDRNDKF